MMMFGWGEMFVIAAVIAIAFNFRKLPMLVKSAKESMKSFQSGVRGEEEARKIRDVTPDKDED